MCSRKSVNYPVNRYRSSKGKPTVRILAALLSGQVRAAITSGNSREAQEKGARDSASVVRPANQVKSTPMNPHRILIYKVFPKCG